MFAARICAHISHRKSDSHAGGSVIITTQGILSVGIKFRLFNHWNTVAQSKRTFFLLKQIIVHVEIKFAHNIQVLKSQAFQHIFSEQIIKIAVKLSWILRRFQRVEQAFVVFLCIVFVQKVWERRIVHHIGKLFHSHNHISIAVFIKWFFGIKQIRTGSDIQAVIFADKRIFVGVFIFKTTISNIGIGNHISAERPCFKRAAVTDVHRACIIGWGIEIKRNIRADYTIVDNLAGIRSWEKVRIIK